MGRLRIIAGELKGRRILVPPGPGVRPTPERVREALFAILGRRVIDARVLDAYSGSGALGFEALSRGAREVSFIESSSTAVRNLRRNAGDLGVRPRCRILHGDVVKLLGEGIPGPLDLVLADPPYGTGEAARLLGALAGSPALAAGSLIVLEREGAEDATDGRTTGLILERSARYGRSRLDFYGRAGPS